MTNDYTADEQRAADKVKASHEAFSEAVKAKGELKNGNPLGDGNIVTTIERIKTNLDKAGYSGKNGSDNPLDYNEREIQDALKEAREIGRNLGFKPGTPVSDAPTPLQSPKNNHKENSFIKA